MSNSPSSKPVRVVVATALTLAAVVALSGHTMFLKLDSYFLEPNSRATVQLINGEWELSENVITRDRMLDVSIVGPGGTANPPCLLYTSPSPRDRTRSRMPSSA